MNDLRYDPADPTDAHAADPREATQYDLPAVTLPAGRIDPDQLRTERSRTCAAELAVLREAIERLADSVTVLMLERDMAKEREGKHE